MSSLKKRGSTSNIFRIKILDTTATDPNEGITGLLFSSSGLIISTICDNEATTTIYTAAAGNVETITTLGTYQTPTASKCRFKEVDATNNKGLYEVHLADARFAVASSTELVVITSGATDAGQNDLKFDIVAYDPQDAVRLGVTALPNAAADGAGGLPISDAGGLDMDNQPANVKQINGTTITGDGSGTPFNV